MFTTTGKQYIGVTREFWGRGGSKPQRRLAVRAIRTHARNIRQTKQNIQLVGQWKKSFAVRQPKKQETTLI